MGRRRPPPFPLNGGLQLDPASGKVTGLLDVLNMEPRRGALATRRGMECIGHATHDTGPITHTQYPASAIGSAYCAWGFSAISDINTYTGEGINGIACFLHFYTSFADTLECGKFVLSYTNDSGGWSNLDYVNLTQRNNGDITFSDVSIGFIMPQDWGSQDPYGVGSKKWLRVTRELGTFSGAVIAPISSKFDKSKGLYSFRARSGWKTLLVSRIWGIYDAVRATDLNSAPFGVSYYEIHGSLKHMSSDTIAVGTPFYFHGKPSYAMQYIPATDELIIDTDIGFRVLNCGDDFYGTNEFTLLGGDSGADTAWSDIPTEGAFPIPVAMTVYSGRLFIADAEGSIWWTAPAEYWKILPSQNTYRLIGDGAGEVMAMEELFGSLYIFTSTSIYRAAMGDPVAGQDSLVFFNLVDRVGCAAGATVVKGDGYIFFLSSDGVRAFDGQTARTVSDAVSEIFTHTSEHRLACRRTTEAHAVYNAGERRYLLFYPMADASEIDTCLVLDMPTGTWWLWGSDPLAGLDTPTVGGANAPAGQRRHGIKGQFASYRPDLGKVVTASKYGFTYFLGEGYLDAGAPIEWRAESHHFQIGNMEKQRVSRVDVTVRRETTANVKVAVVVDGRREDSRTLAVEMDGVNPATQAFGVFDATGAGMTEERDPYAPLIWRGVSTGRNHRVKISSAGSEHTHAEIAAVAIEVDEV